MSNRPRGRSRSPRRLTSWISGNAETGAVSTAGGAIRELTLFVPLEDHEGATLIRIVGSVALYLDVDAADPVLLSWGIYKAGSGSVGDLSLSPSSPLDRESEHWMHMRFLSQNKNVNVGDGQITVGGYEAEYVDIKVMRKVQEGDGIKIALTCAANFLSMVNLRCLLKHT